MNMNKRKNLRVVKAILSLPVSNVREILTGQAVHSKILSDKIDVLDKAFSSSFKDSLVELSHIENSLDKLRIYIERVSILFSFLFFLLFICLIFS